MSSGNRFSPWRMPTSNLKEDELKDGMEGITRDLKECHAGNISHWKSALDTNDELRATPAVEGEVNPATAVTGQEVEGTPRTSRGRLNWKAGR